MERITTEPNLIKVRTEECNNIPLLQTSYNKIFDRLQEIEVSHGEIDKLLGTTVYVSVTGNYLYEAKLLGYGAYGSNKEHQTYCVQVIKEGGHTFVDYFLKIYTKEDYEKWKEEYFTNKHVHGQCQFCKKDFSSELISSYKIVNCPWCGEPINKTILNNGGENK